MQNSTGKTLTQIGGFLMIVSLALPWFMIDIAGLAHINFKIWDLNQNGGIAVAVVGAFCVVQIRAASEETMAVIYLIVGVGAAALISYKVYGSPPGSAAMDGLKGPGGVSIEEILKAMGIAIKPTFGAWLAIGGAGLAAVGSFMAVREGGASKTHATGMNWESVSAPGAAAHRATPPAAPRYSDQVNQDQQAAPQAGYGGDPFAVPRQPGEANRNNAPDPFARPAQAAATGGDPFAPPGQRPPGC